VAIPTRERSRIRALQAEVERTFPEASRFIRPGFDEMTGL